MPTEQQPAHRHCRQAARRPDGPLSLVVGFAQEHQDRRAFSRHAPDGAGYRDLGANGPRICPRSWLMAYMAAVRPSRSTRLRRLAPDAAGECAHNQRDREHHPECQEVGPSWTLNV